MPDNSITIQKDITNINQNNLSPSSKGKDQPQEIKPSAI
jgi:hypothetical protein